MDGFFAILCYFFYDSDFILYLRILFFPIFSIDQRRISKKQDGLIPCCMVHQEFGNSSNKGQENWAKNCLSFCANLVRIKAFKVSKVQLFWEGHKNLHNLPDGFDIYLCLVHVIWTERRKTNLMFNVCFDFFSRHKNQIWK